MPGPTCWRTGSRACDRAEGTEPVSRERARRRAEREAAAAAERARRERARARAARRAALSPLRLVGRRPRSAPGARAGSAPDSPLRRHHKRQNGILLAILIPANVVVWLLQPEWGWRVGALVLSVFAWPLLIVVLFDRRPAA